MTRDPFAPIPAATTAGSSGAKAKKAKPGDTPVAVDPAAHPPMPLHPKLGEPIARWLYRDRAGRVVMEQCRFDTPSGKEFRVQAPFREAGTVRWRWSGLPQGERPLYRLDALAAAPAATVLVCAGDKAADAAARLAPLAVATTSPNGATNARHADWRPLAGRHVVIWPDRDAPGRAYAADAARLALAAGALSARVLTAPDGPDDGWDAADAVAEGMTAEVMFRVICVHSQ